MKIIHFTRSLQKGGASKIMFFISSGLSFENDIILWGNKNSKNEFNAFLTKDIQNQLRKYGISSFSLAFYVSKILIFFRPFILLLNIYFTYKQKKDVIYHFHYANGLRDAYILSKFGYKVIYTLHQTPEKHMYTYFIKASRLHNFNLICVSEYLQDLLISNGEIKCQVINNGLPLSNNTPIKSWKILSKENQTVLTCISRFNNEKGLIYLFDAVEYLVLNRYNIYCNIIGDGPLLNDFRLLIHKAKLDIYFNLPGFQSTTTSFFLNTDIYIQPSKKESFSLSLLEAMNFGLRCIVSDNTGMVKLLNGLGLSFKNSNSTDLARQIKFVIDSGKDFVSSNEAICKESKKYNLSEMLKKYDELYKIK